MSLNSTKITLDDASFIQILANQTGTIMPEPQQGVVIRVGTNAEANEITLPSGGVQFLEPVDVWARDRKRAFGHTVLEVIK